MSADEPLKLTVRGTSTRTLDDYLKSPTVIEEAVKRLSRLESERLENEALTIVLDRMAEGESYEAAVAGTTLIYEYGKPTRAARVEDVPGYEPVFVRSMAEYDEHFGPTPTPPGLVTCDVPLSGPTFRERLASRLHARADRIER